MGNPMPWGTEDYLLVAICDRLDRLWGTNFAGHFHKRPPSIEPMWRPGMKRQRPTFLRVIDGEGQEAKDTRAEGEAANARAASLLDRLMPGGEGLRGKGPVLRSTSNNPLPEVTGKPDKE